MAIMGELAGVDFDDVSQVKPHSGRVYRGIVKSRSPQHRLASIASLSGEEAEVREQNTAADGSGFSG